MDSNNETCPSSDGDFISIEEDFLDLISKNRKGKKYTKKLREKGIQKLKKKTFYLVSATDYREAIATWDLGKQLGLALQPQCHK